MLLTELPAHPVHPGPDSEGEDEIHRIFQRAEQRLAEESHHGHHNGLARQKGEQIALLVKIRDAKGQMHKGAWREGQQREHEQRRSVKAVHPLLSLFQLGPAGSQLPEIALDQPPPQQKHDAAVALLAEGVD